MSHIARPVPAKRLFADMHYPTRESDGDWHCGEMIDTRQAWLQQCRRMARESIGNARQARLDGREGDADFYLTRAKQWRRELAEAKQ